MRAIIPGYGLWGVLIEALVGPADKRRRRREAIAEAQARYDKAVLQQCDDPGCEGCPRCGALMDALVALAKAKEGK